MANEQMNNNEGRTTKRIYSFEELINQLAPDELISGKWLEGVKTLVNGSHPLPTIYLKQDVTGKISVLGNQTRDILATLLALRVLASLHRTIKKISAYELRATVLEYTPGQEKIIEAYQEAGFI